MRWEDAIRLSPRQLSFLLASEEDAKAISRRCYVKFLEASGDIKSPEQMRKVAKEYMAALRREHGGG